MRIKTETIVGVFVLASVVVFSYMALTIGAWRFDTVRYSRYVVYFHDISGLTPKSDVRIAGVKVGWVDGVDLVNNGQQVRAEIMVFKEYALHSNAYGIIRQDGLLGTKFLELVPGDPLQPRINPGGILVQPSHDGVGIDTLLHKVNELSDHLVGVTQSLNNAVGGPVGSERLEQALVSFARAAEHIAQVAQRCDAVVSGNEAALRDAVSDLRAFAADLRREFPNLAESVSDSAQRLSTMIDHDLHETIEPMREVACKINNGRGALGTLINDQQLADQIKQTVQGVRDYAQYIDRLGIVFDMYFQSMYGPGQICMEDAKGYFNVRIHPQDDYFYLLGLVGTYSGRIKRYDAYRAWFDGCDQQLVPTHMNLDDADRLKYAEKKRTVIREYDEILLNAQFGKIYRNIAVRLGLFESTFGVALDYELPFSGETVRWITTLEAYDFRGRNRICDDRPHLTWMNRIFFTDSAYLVFGADDFVSQTNKNAFVGAGLRFADDDVKFLVSRLPLGS